MWLQRLLCLVLFTYTLSCYAQNANDLIITELMVNPKPSHGLPEKEYIEIYNRTDKAIQLNNLKLQINNVVHILPNASIAANEYALICEKIDEKTFSVYGKVLSVSSIALNNSGATVSLHDAKNKTIFSLTYSDKWYPSGKNGGYSLEMIDTNYPCVETENWGTSEAKEGGSPDKVNSVKASKPDLTPPDLIRYEITSPTNLKLVFSEKLDSLSAISKLAYTIDKSLVINKIAIESPQNLNINLGFSSPILDNTIYSLIVRNIQDCSGNLLKEAQIKFGNVQLADSSNVILNELLFNPQTGGEDFVEIYNRTDKFISLKDWSLANVDKTGKIANVKKIATNDYILLPKQFLALTKNAQTIKNQYPKSVVENLWEMPSLPSFPDDAGTVLLLNDKNKVFDRLDYAANWHSPFLDNSMGVSLERKFIGGLTNDKNNWQSAAANENYATPGYANSQGNSDSLNTLEGFTVSPEIFTPDGDGHNDLTNLNYRCNTAGNFANIKIFDINGKFVRQLADNQLLGISGSMEWDGSNSFGQKVSVGYYIIFIELFNPNGETKSYKVKVVVGSKY